MLPSQGTSLSVNVPPLHASQKHVCGPTSFNLCALVGSAAAEPGGGQGCSSTLTIAGIAKLGLQLSRALVEEGSIQRRA